jgi:hypothetical protein
MTPRRFRWMRIQRILNEDPTALLELAVTLCYVFLQGVFLATGTSQVPFVVESWLMWGAFNSQRFGLSLILLSLAQVWSVGTEWYTVRGWISFTIALNALAVAFAYWFAGVTDRYVFPFLLGTICIEGFLTARDWHAAKVAKVQRLQLQGSPHDHARTVA